MFISRNMAQKAQELQTQFDLLHEKIARLRKALAIEADPALKFKLEKQLEEAEAEREQIELELQQLEQQHETRKAVSVQPDVTEPPSYPNNRLSEPVFEKTREIASETQVFICYAREDHEVAKKLYKDLKRVGVTPWLDTEDILPGQNWKVTTKKALRASAYVLVLLSSHSVSKRGFVQKEIKMALDILDEFPPDEIFIIPARLDDCEPTDERLQDLQWVDLSSYETGLNQILRVLLPNQNEKQNHQAIEKSIPKLLSESAQSLLEEIRKDTRYEFQGLTILYSSDDPFYGGFYVPYLWWNNEKIDNSRYPHRPFEEIRKIKSAIKELLERDILREYYTGTNDNTEALYILWESAKPIIENLAATLLEKIKQDPHTDRPKGLTIFPLNDEKTMGGSVPYLHDGSELHTDIINIIGICLAARILEERGYLELLKEKGPRIRYILLESVK